MSEEDKKEKIQMFDDDSKAFKLLWHELKDVKDVVIHDIKDAAVQNFKDADEYLLNAFAKASDKVNTYLHYTSDDLRKDNEAKRRAIEKAERVGFKNKIVLPNEGMDDNTVEQRYHQLPGDAEKCEICKSKDNTITSESNVNVESKTELKKKKRFGISV